MSKPNTIVAIGASAGGLKALQDFFSHMPSTTGLSFVVVQHLLPDFKSNLPSLLSQCTKMKVIEASDGVQPEANTIYLTPSNKMIAMQKGAFSITDLKPNELPKFIIDHYFTSLARDQKENSVAIILSGAGNDGSKGIVDIHQVGGLVLAQDTSTSAFDSMPKNAILTNAVSIILAPQDMPKFILNYLDDLKYQTKIDNHGNVLVLNDSFTPIFKKIHSRYGINLYDYKPTTIYRRITRRMKILGSKNASDYLTSLDSNAKELDELAKDLLIHVTSFFRDETYFHILSATVIPELFKTASDTVRIWICGCSTGQEVYSIAMLCEEYLQNSPTKKDYKIFATDALQETVDFASQGVFPEAYLNQNSSIYQPLLKKYFRHTQDGEQVLPRIRNRIVFTTQNVITDPPFTKMDLISCRNLLIYFQPEIQKKVLQNLHFGLKKGSYLFLGASESLGELENVFDVVNAKAKIFRKVRDIRFHLNRSAQPNTLGEINSSSIAERRGLNVPRSLATYEYDAILKEIVSDGILINDQNQLTHCFGNARSFIHIPEGQFGTVTDIFRLIEKPFKVPLSTALNRAKKDKKVIVFDRIEIENEGVAELFKLIVKPLGLDINTHSQYTLILFERDEEHEALRVNSKDLNLDAHTEKIISNLEMELQHTRESLQATLEEIETSNEELQSANEELIASNEELQSTNEELQSVNEELYTMNSEYQSKIDELVEANSDLDNFIASTDIGTIFVNSNQEIRKFTPSVTKHFDLIESDIGRPLSHFSHKIHYKDILKDIDYVILNKESLEREVKNKDGRWYLLRITPHMTKGTVGGAVLLFIDVNELKLVQEEVKQQKEELVRNQSIVYDAYWDWYIQEDYEYMSPQFWEMLGYDPKEKAHHHSEWEKVVHPDDLPSAKENLEKHIQSKGQHPYRQTLRYYHNDGSLRWLVSRGNMVQWDYDGKPIRMIGLHEDITELKQLQEKYELVMMATGTGVWDWPDITKDKAIWDDNYFRLLGYEPGELTPSVSTYQSLAYPGEYTGVDLSKVTDGMSYQTEIRLRHKNGFYYWFLINGIFSYNSNSKTYRLTGSIMRIHERKMAEQRFRLAVEASPNAMIMINKEQNIVMVNHQAVTLFQYSEEELQKMSIHQLLPERFRPNHGKLVSQFMQEPQRVTLSKGRELYGIKKDGTEVRVELGLTPIEIDQEIFVISSIVDLTESVKAREELEKHQLKALEAARMAHIGEMAAGIAHEINNPLTIIKGRIHSMKSLLQSDCDQSTIANNLVKIESTVDRIAAIIRGLRTFSRDGGHDEMRLITVEHLINETFDYCKSRLKNDGVELKVDIENPSLQFPCRSVQLSQVLLNMIQNSRDAIISQNDPWIAIKAWSNKKSLCISITDSGSGVPDQIREKLFDPFFTTKEVGKGTGLGLSLSKSIIESHNGSLSLDTKSPNTKFIISLPLN